MIHTRRDALPSGSSSAVERRSDRPSSPTLASGERGRRQHLAAVPAFTSRQTLQRPGARTRGYVPRLLKEACLRGTRLRQDERVAAREATRREDSGGGGAGRGPYSAQLLHCRVPMPSSSTAGLASACPLGSSSVIQRHVLCLSSLRIRMAIIRARLVTKNFYLTFRHIYGALNIIKKIKLILQFRCTRRDESFEPN